jgi:hypothetical protein
MWTLRRLISTLATTNPETIPVCHPVTELSVIHRGPDNRFLLNVTDEELRKGLEVSWKRRTLKAVAGGQNA